MVLRTNNDGKQCTWYGGTGLSSGYTGHGSRYGYGTLRGMRIHFLFLLRENAQLSAGRLDISTRSAGQVVWQKRWVRTRRSHVEGLRPRVKRTACSMPLTSSKMCQHFCVAFTFSSFHKLRYQFIEVRYMRGGEPEILCTGQCQSRAQENDFSSWRVQGYPFLSVT